MRFIPIDPPRTFEVGYGVKIRLADCGRLDLEPDEQVTFVTQDGAEYDVARKSWGFYATPSLNRRLPSFGLRAALVRSRDGRAYVMLVEHGRTAEFHAYLAREGLRVLRWLDADIDLDALDAQEGRAPCVCGAAALALVHVYDTPPTGETTFEFSAGGHYRRELRRCPHCGHFVSWHDMDTRDLYRTEYMSTTYGMEGLRTAYERILALPSERSDNAGRVQRVVDFARHHFGDERPRTALDVGSGLCVFLHGMKRAGWQGIALDPDPGAVAHARQVVGVEAVCGDFTAMTGVPVADVVTFNKVLEHVVDPIAMLARAHTALGAGGFVYVELPDGETAFSDSPGREEFFVEHWHAFSPASLAVLAARAGFRVETIERLREPSGKYTLRAFLTPAESR